MLEVIKSKGLTGGFNFDAKTRRPSNTIEDMFEAYILGMDTFALGLINASKIIEDGRIEEFIKQKYSSFEEGIGMKIRNNAVTLEDLANYAKDKKVCANPGSGKQEYLEAIVNQIMFGK